MRFEIVGSCVYCGVSLRRGNAWLEESFGKGDLYHFGTGSLLCDQNGPHDGLKATLYQVNPYEIKVDPEPFCTLVVTFIDGAVVEYPNIRFQDKLSEPDPIKINGTTVVVENKDQTITLLAVRSFKMEFPDAE